MFKICSPAGKFIPHFHLEKPAEYKINPYTGRPSERQVIDYAGNQVSVEEFRNWITKSVPDYSRHLKTVNEYTKFNAEDDIAKVYLISGKNTPSPLYGALTSNFRNKVRFAFASE